MGKVVGVVVLILAIAAGVIYGVPSVRARVLGVPLKMQFKQGQESKMKLNVSGKVKADVTGLPDGLAPEQVKSFLGVDIPFKIEMRYRQVTKSVTGDVAEIESTVEGGTAEITLPGSKEPISYPIPAGSPSTVKMDSQGRIQLDNAGTPPPGVKPEDMKKVEEFLGTLSGGFLPGDTKRVGQTWSNPINLPITTDKAKVTISGNLAYTFAGVEKKANVNVADISGTQDIKVDVSTDQNGADVKLTGGLTGANQGYFDWANGQITGTDGDGKLDLTLTVKKAPIDATAHLTGDVKVSMEKI